LQKFGKLLLLLPERRAGLSGKPQGEGRIFDILNHSTAKDWGESEAPLAGCWLGLDWMSDARSQSRHPVAFRAGFDLAHAPLASRWRVSASHPFLLWINGARALCGPPRSWPHSKIFDEADFSAHLCRGRNEIAVLMMPPTGATGYSVQTRSGFWLEARVSSEGESVLFTSDDSWRARRAAWIDTAHLLHSLPTGAQEHFDSAQEPPDWKTAPPDGAWCGAWVLGSAGTPPWNSLRRRPVARPREDPLPARLVWRGRGDARTPSISSNLAEGFNADSLVGSEIAIPDNALWQPLRAGEVLCYDCGKTRLIRPVWEVEGVEGTLRLEAFYDSGRSERPTAMRGFGTGDEGACDSFVPLTQEASQRWETVGARGGRFASLRLTGEGTCRVRPLMEAVEYPFADGAAFECDDPFWMRAWEVSKQSLRSCASDCFVDTPARENTLWTLDACVSGLAGWHSFGEVALWRHSLELVAGGIDAEGVPRAVVPAEPSFMALFDQTMMWVVSCEKYLLQTGDAAFAHEVAPAITRFLAGCERHFSSEGLWVPPSWSWYWLDWAPIDKRAYSLPIQAQLLRAARAALSVTSFIGEGPEGESNKDLCISSGEVHISAKEIAKSAREIAISSEEIHKSAKEIPISLADLAISRRETRSGNEDFALREVGARIVSRLEETLPRFFDEDAGAFRDHLAPRVETASLHPLSHSAPDAPAMSIHSNVLACEAGAGDAVQRGRALEYLTAHLESARFGPAFLAQLLSPFCPVAGERVLNLLRARLSPYIEAGAPTWPETLDGEQTPSPFNSAHAYGASLNTLLVEGALGLRPLSLGWRRFAFEPARERETGKWLLHCAYSLRTPAGEIAVRLDEHGAFARWPADIELQWRGVALSGTEVEQQLP